MKIARVLQWVALSSAFIWMTHVASALPIPGTLAA